MDRIRSRHLARVDVLERAVLALMDGTLTDALRDHAESEAHALASAMPSLGARDGGRLARVLEQSFAARHTLERRLATRLADHVVALRTELERPLAEPDERSRGDDRPRIVVLTADAAQGERYLTEALAGGVEVQLHGHDVEAETVRRLAPRAIIVELPPGPAPQALAAVRRMARLGVPVLVVGGSGTLEERLAIARSRAVGPLAQPVGPADVLRHAAQLVEERRVPPGTVLVVDTDPYAAQIARVTLERAGHLVYTLSDPGRVWETLETVVPEVMLVGARLGACSGVDLARATRADPRWRDLPVLLAAAAHEEALVREAYCDGIDDVLRKPLDPRLLAARITNRLRLSRQLRRRDETDPVTGLASRSKGERDLERLVRLARRHGQPFALLTVRLDRHDRMRARHGQAAVDVALRRLGQLAREQFRADDVIARWGANELVVGLYGANADASRARARELMATLRGSRVTGAGGVAVPVSCSIGLATAPEVAPDLATLHDAADSALVGAGAHEADEVLALASDPGASDGDRVDVLLVDDDPTAASLVLHALEGRRCQVRWLRDGADALAALRGDRPGVSARVVVLEVNLPSLDGLSVLRALAAEQALRRTRVIMLSSRDSEAETLQAFELGAFDYVAKPFSVAVLAERVRRALLA